MTREQFEAAIAEFDARAEQALQTGSLEAVEALYEECIRHLDGEEPTDEEVTL
jgi:hypothetical protein